MGVEGFGGGLGWAVGCRFRSLFFLILLGKQLVVERIFEYNRGMQLGDPTATTREPRSRLDEALDTFENSLAELISTVETGGLDHLSAEEKVAVWQRSKPSATGCRSSITG